MQKFTISKGYDARQYYDTEIMAESLEDAIELASDAHFDNQAKWTEGNVEQFDNWETTSIFGEADRLKAVCVSEGTAWEIAYGEECEETQECIDAYENREPKATGVDLPVWTQVENEKDTKARAIDRIRQEWEGTTDCPNEILDACLLFILIRNLVECLEVLMLGGIGNHKNL